MSPTRIRYRHLQCFLAIAQLKSVRAAADMLSVTQPALSKTLRELEVELDVKLFTRDRTGMSLTRFGEIFLRHAAGSMTSLRKGIDEINLARSAGSFGLSMGMMPNVAEVLLPSAVATFKRTMPKTKVHIVTGTNSSLLDQIRIGALDLAVGRLAQPEYMTDLSFEALYDEELVVVARRRHPAQTKRWSIRSAREYPWILPPHGSIMRLEIDRFLLSHNIAVHENLVETMSVTFGKSHALQTDALWFVPAGAVQTELDAKRLRKLPLPTGAMVGAVGVTTKANAALSSAATEMVRSLRLAAREKGTPRHN